MRLIKTTPGKTYAVTTPGACQVKYELQSGDVVTVLDVATAGQYYFVAVGGYPEVTNDNAALTECFNSAPAGVSSGGGEVKPDPEGMEAISGIPDDNMLHDKKVYMINNPTAEVDLSILNMHVPAGRVATCELWLAMGANIVPVTFPVSWQWVSARPDMSTPMRSYRFTMRLASGQRPEICHSYTALNYQ